ncbi:MAG: hypothetical protein AAFN70_00150 [Planctomycetota bacterium]
MKSQLPVDVFIGRGVSCGRAIPAKIVARLPTNAPVAISQFAQHSLILHIGESHDFAGFLALVGIVWG